MQNDDCVTVGIPPEVFCWSENGIVVCLLEGSNALIYISNTKETLFAHRLNRQKKDNRITHHVHFVSIVFSLYDMYCIV